MVDADGVEPVKVLCHEIDLKLTGFRVIVDPVDLNAAVFQSDLGSAVFHRKGFIAFLHQFTVDHKCIIIIIGVADKIPGDADAAEELQLFFGNACFRT